MTGKGPSGTVRKAFGNGPKERNYSKSVHPDWLTMEQACTAFGVTPGTMRDSVNGRHDSNPDGVEVNGIWYLHRDAYLRRLCAAWGYKSPEKMP